MTAIVLLAGFAMIVEITCPWLKYVLLKLVIVIVVIGVVVVIMAPDHPRVVASHPSRSRGGGVSSDDILRAMEAQRSKLERCAAWNRANTWQPVPWSECE